MEYDFRVLYLENQLCFPIYAASRLTTKIYEPYLSALNITYPQYLLLLVLWKEDNKTVSEIGKALFLESNTLTPLLKRLEQKKLISRKRSSEDERKVMVSLTEKGSNLKKSAVTIPEQIIQSFSGGTIAPGEIAEFRNTLNKLIQVLDQRLEAMGRHDDVRDGTQQH